MAGKRTFTIGKVRVAAKVPPHVPVRAFTVGKIKESARVPNTSRGAHQCGQCSPRYIHGNATCAKGCPGTVVIYRALDASVTWPCPFNCDPTPLSFGYTHHYQCDFWATHPTAHPL